MSTVTHLEKRKLEELLGMSGGYVLDFTNRSFTDFFRDTVAINIDSPKYAKDSGSKANRLRAFWELESNSMAGKILEGLLQIWLHTHNQQRSSLYLECEVIVNNLLNHKTIEITEDDFLAQPLPAISLAKLPVEASLIPILEARLREAECAAKHGMALSAVVLCGSILEGILLGLAQNNVCQFNQCVLAPKDKESKVKRLQDWSLADLIEVSHQCGYLPLDIKRFSHDLREFRNFIHPYEQMRTGFTPSSQTANLCWHVLVAAMNSLETKL